MFLGFYVANAFHEYLVRILVGMGWIVVEEREEFETLKYVYASPVGIFTYLWGRSTIKFLQATVSLVLILSDGLVGAGAALGLGAGALGPAAALFGLGLTAVVYFGFLVAGWALVLPRAAISLNEGVAAGLYLLCGVIFPIDLCRACSSGSRWRSRSPGGTRRCAVFCSVTAQAAGFSGLGSRAGRDPGTHHPGAVVDLRVGLPRPRARRPAAGQA